MTGRLLGCTLLVLFQFCPHACAVSPQLNWPLTKDLKSLEGPAFTIRPGGERWVAKDTGQALRIAAGSPASCPLPADYAQSGSLSFYYRLPEHARVPQKLAKAVEVLRLGSFRLLYQKQQFLWIGVDDQAVKPRSVVQQLPVADFMLVEVGWSSEQRVVIFVNGLMSNWFDFAPLAEPAMPLMLSLSEGDFSDMRLESDALVSGTRYRGVLSCERFDNDRLSDLYKTRNKESGARLIPGFDGSPFALATPVKGGNFFSISLPAGQFRVTEDTYVCGAWFSSSGKSSTTLVRLWPKLDDASANHRLKRELPRGEWRPERIPVFRFGVKAGWIVDGVYLGSLGPGERWLAADNICIVRGTELAAPTAPAKLQAATKDGDVSLSWEPAQASTCVAGYEVFWANVPDLDGRPSEVIAQTLQRSFVHDTIPRAGEWYYSVAAIDLFGRRGPLAAPVRVLIDE